MKWKENLKTFFNARIKQDTSCKFIYEKLGVSINDVGLHLAIFNEPFLELLINGQKTIESRFSINRTSPFRKVTTGDIVFIKKSGGDVCGYFIVGKVYYYDSPTAKVLSDIKDKFSHRICSTAVQDFWDDRAMAKCVSLFEVIHVKKISPFKIDKRDRTAWAPIVLSNKIIVYA